MATDVLDLFARVKFDSSEFNSGMSSAESAFSGFSDIIKSGFSALSAAAISFAKDSVTTGEQFDASMAQVAATMGSTVDEIQELRDFAKEMGRTTAFTASESAQALNYMALAGYDAEKSMEMLPTVLNLAAAGGMELATASDMVTDAQSALGLSIEETTEMVDKMAAAASHSNTSVSQLGSAFLTVGGTAKNLKGGTTELSTILGILANNGIKGAEGGTALRNILNSLAAPTGDAAETLEALNVQVYDAEGNMRSLNDIFGDMKFSLDQLTQQDRMQAISNIFNLRDMKSAEAILGSVGDTYYDLASAIDSAAGSAGKMAETQLDTLQGDKTKFKSALEGIKISISEAITPSYRELVKFGTKWIGTITDSFEQAGVKGATHSMIWMVKSGISQLSEAIPEIASTIFDDIIQPIGSELMELMPDWLSDDIKSVFSSVKDFVGNIDFGNLKDKFGGFAESIGELAEKLSGGIAWAFENVLKPLGTWLMNDAIPVALDVFKGVLDNINNALTILEPVGKAVWGEFFKPLFSGIGDLAVGTFDLFGKALKDIADTFKDFDTIGFIDDIMQGNFGEDWMIGIKDIGKTIEGLGEKIDDFFSANGPAQLWNELWQNIGGAIFDAKEIITGAIDAIIKGIDDLVGKITSLPSKWYDFWSGFGEYLASDKSERHMIDSNADGGYVSSPRLSWVGEKEPEYIIPESKMDRVFKNDGYTFNFYYQGGSGMSDAEIEAQARKLAELSIAQIRAIGGTGF